MVALIQLLREKDIWNEGDAEDGSCDLPDIRKLLSTKLLVLEYDNIDSISCEPMCGICESTDTRETFEAMIQDEIPWGGDEHCKLCFECFRARVFNFCYECKVHDKKDTK